VTPADPGSDPALAESYRILRSRLGLSGLPPLSRAVTEHVIHATADFDYVTDLVCDEPALASGLAALRRSGLPSLSNISEKGGPAVAVAAFDALLWMAQYCEEEAHA
jgi:precorrin isomerase